MRRLGIAVLLGAASLVGAPAEGREPPWDQVLEHTMRRAMRAHAPAMARCVRRHLGASVDGSVTFTVEVRLENARITGARIVGGFRNDRLEACVERSLAGVSVAPSYMPAQVRARVPVTVEQVGRR